MVGTKSDVTRLVEFSLKYPLDSALAQFTMFTKQQVRALYKIGVSDRKRLLAGRGADSVLGSIERPFRHHRSPAQAEKMVEQATDPSNG